MILKIRVFAIIIVAFGVLPFPAFAQSADIVLINGNILTADASFSARQAVAIRGECFLYVGDDFKVRQLMDSNTKLIDLKGKTVIPGLIDNHVNFIRHALRWENALSRCRRFGRSRTAGSFGDSARMQVSWLHIRRCFLCGGPSRAWIWAGSGRFRSLRPFPENKPSSPTRDRTHTCFSRKMGWVLSKKANLPTSSCSTAIT